MSRWLQQEVTQRNAVAADEECAAGGVFLGEERALSAHGCVRQVRINGGLHESSESRM
ncbi:MAG TPA: hypothetical protein VHW65_04515 [Gemmatimonadales bacterium]|jgi:hypothetical protein|nr:hypothetical protein [Gemmatimonadales bacterium]